MTESITPVDFDIPKAEWGDGPWQNEPDRAEWRDAKTGMACLALRNRSGVWCGYVAVTSDHPAYDKRYDDVDVSVHGGLTYANRCSGRICHVPEPGEPDDVYWLGFDCHHCYDFAPAYFAQYKHRGYPFDEVPSLEEVYRTLEYVKAECADLANQLKSMDGAQNNSH